MRFTLGCVAASVLLAFLPGIEAVAHERLFSRAIDPLAGADSRRLVVNQRYVQNTLEQLWVFAPGLALLGLYADPRVVAATAITWVIGRWAYWIGYHRDPLWRGIGASSLAQSLIVLAYGVGCFGHELAGWAGVAALLGPFLAIEAYLFAALRKPPVAER
ncbi:MAPEG family protein [Sphingomonas sp. BT-65]|uniref:MAPEG family protein n=1 Tax=Sphingomonas sp. BT-65 TaxID=2989821 RepID=UPI002236B4A0|nr:MAPEG family protein [Sphingomonas sp. BT-65]MCW4462323.1 MAPEG family protein [Sphingomonas sp. BT-65]